MAFVAGVETGEPVAHDDPVDGAAIGQSAPLALLPDRLGIDTGALDLLALAIEAGQQIEVEKTVVQRRDQDVRVGMADARKARIAARRIDDDEVAIGKICQGPC